MTEDVIITIKGYHNIDGSCQEPVVTSARGKYYFRSGHHFVSYEENVADGMAPSKSLIKIGENYLGISRKGDCPTKMELETGKKNLTRYRTPAGVLEFFAEAEQIQVREEEKRLEAEAEYSLHSGGQQIQKSRVAVIVEAV